MQTDVNVLPELAADAAPDIDVQRSVDGAQAPEDAHLLQAALATLSACERSGALSICLVSDAEIRDMNHRYRGKDRATNVLSFPQDVSDENGRALLGDVLLCPVVIEREAHEQGKLASHHYLHMVVHGVFHLLGFDHETPDEAETMEAHERTVLSGLGIPDPYADHPHPTNIMESRTATDG